jgi:hypothetical protein
VENAAKYLARHPVLVGLAFAALSGMGAYNVFRAGVTYADLRAAVGDQARVASEALGG